jgi:hypothetical protein
MNLFSAHPAYPKDRDLTRVVQAAASRLAGKIERLDVASLDLSMETRGLFEHDRVRLRDRVQRCACVFAWSLPQNERPFTDLTLVAFKDGLGVFSLLAKECSIGKVVYNDSNDALRCDARTIARAIGQPADYYVFGDAEEVAFVVKRYSIACDVFVTCDTSLSAGARAMPYTLTALLNEVSEESMGALSLALALEQRPSDRSARQHLANDFDRLSGELGGAGFDVKRLRLRDRSGGALVLAGSRPAGAYGSVDTPTPEAAGSQKTRGVEANSVSY